MLVRTPSCPRNGRKDVQQSSAEMSYPGRMPIAWQRRSRRAAFWCNLAESQRAEQPAIYNLLGDRQRPQS